MATTQILRGLGTVNLFAADHEAAKKWYSELLGIQPYFERPGYAEFRIGDYMQELGLVDAKFAPGGVADKPGGIMLYWHVDDLAASLERLQALGATLFDPIRERGAGFVTASVIDPFGNILGIMYNPHYVEMLNEE